MHCWKARSVIGRSRYGGGSEGSNSECQWARLARFRSACRCRSVAIFRVLRSARVRLFMPESLYLLKDPVHGKLLLLAPPAVPLDASDAGLVRPLRERLATQAQFRAKHRG